MNNPVILKKMESLNRCLNRIEEKQPQRADELQTDLDLQDIISINLERAVQISVDIAAVVISNKGLKSGNTMAESFQIMADAGLITVELAERMQKAVGFRNISVHEYQSIDWELVFDIIKNHLGNFKDFMKALL